MYGPYIHHSPEDGGPLVTAWGSVRERESVSCDLAINGIDNFSRTHCVCVCVCVYTLSDCVHAHGK